MDEINESGGQDIPTSTNSESKGCLIDFVNLEVGDIAYQ